MPTMQSASGLSTKQVFAQVSPQVAASFNALYVYACTAQGKSAVRKSAAARFCIRSATRDKDYLFIDVDCAKFDNMVGMSEVAVPCLSSCMPLAHQVLPDMHHVVGPCRLALCYELCTEFVLATCPIVIMAVIG